MEILQFGIKKSKIKILKNFFIILICLLMVIYLFCSNPYNEINTLSELSDILRIDLINDIDQLYDIEYDNSVGETNLNIYYSITDLVFKDKEYYQFRTDYNPMPSLSNKSFVNGLFKENNDIDDNNIAYVNIRFSEYKISNLFRKLSSQIDVYIHIIKPQNNDENFKVILSTSLPKVKINISKQDLLFSNYIS